MSLPAPSYPGHSGHKDSRTDTESLEEAAGGGVGVEFGHGEGAFVDVEFEGVGEFGEGGGGWVGGEEGEDRGAGYAGEDGAVEGRSDDVQT